jgi:hypothetical protein
MAQIYKYFHTYHQAVLALPVQVFHIAVRIIQESFEAFFIDSYTLIRSQFLLNFAIFFQRVQFFRELGFLL